MIVILKSIYPNALIVYSRYTHPWIVLDFNEKAKYSVWMKSQTEFSVFPKKAIWNRTFEMKARAQEISTQIKQFIDNGSLIQDFTSEIPAVCPNCKNPNSKRERLCEWCGGQIC